MSSPNLYAVAAAARTKRLRVGAMGHIVSLHHPGAFARRDRADRSADRRPDRGRTRARHPAGVFRTVQSRLSQPPRGYAGVRPLHEGRVRRRRSRRLGTVRASPTATSISASCRFSARIRRCGWRRATCRRSQFCAKEGLHTGYFLMFPKSEAKKRYAPYLGGLEGQRPSGHAEHRLSARSSTSTRPIRRRSTSRWPTRATPIAGSFRTATTRTRSAASSSRPPSTSKRAASRSRPRSR